MAEWGGSPPAPAAIDPDAAVAHLCAGLAILRRSASELHSFHMHLDGQSLIWSEKALAPGSPIGPTCTAEIATTRLKLCTANPLELELYVGDVAIRLRVGGDEEMAAVRGAWTAAVGAHAVSTGELPNLPRAMSDDELRDDIAQVGEGIPRSRRSVTFLITTSIVTLRCSRRAFKCSSCGPTACSSRAIG